jgi:hypothetical protein
VCDLVVEVTGETISHVLGIVIFIEFKIINIAQATSRKPETSCNFDIILPGKELVFIAEEGIFVALKL